MRFQINDKKTLIQDRTILLSWPPFRLLAKTNQKKTFIQLEYRLFCVQ